MEKEIKSAVIYAAKKDVEKADELIRNYVPFIKAQVSKFSNRFCTESDEEFSLATIAFYESIMGYEEGRGEFLSYASVAIRNRLIDHSRKEKIHRNNSISIYAENPRTNEIIADTLADKKDYVDEAVNVDALRKEIQELTAIMSRFGVGFSDVSDNAPRQRRALEKCNLAICYAIQNRRILKELIDSGKLPLAELASGSGVSRKTLERYRKYVLAMLLIQTNGYELIREHLKGVYRKGGKSE